MTEEEFREKVKKEFGEKITKESLRETTSIATRAFFNAVGGVTLDDDTGFKLSQENTLIAHLVICPVILSIWSTLHGSLNNDPYLFCQDFIKKYNELGLELLVTSRNSENKPSFAEAFKEFLKKRK